MIPVGILTAAATSSFSFLLDEYPAAAAAYSLRKLRAAYTGNCIRVRRDLDNAEINIGFVNNVLDITALQTFVGGNSGFITIWYDQSGNSNNAVSVLSSPAIILTGTLQTLNSKAAINFNLNSLTITGITLNTNISIFMAGKQNNINQRGPFLGGNGAPTVAFGANAFPNARSVVNGGLNGNYNFVTVTADYATINYCIYNMIINTSNYNIYKNNTSFTLDSISGASLSPTTITFLNQYFNSPSVCLSTEIIIYSSDQLSNRSGIVNNMNTYYTIF
jgi:hypothetical protein